MPIRTALLLSTFAILTTSCTPNVAVDSRAADAAAIQALDEQWSATAARNDIERTGTFYDDAVLLPPQRTVRPDRKSIR